MPTTDLLADLDPEQRQVAQELDVPVVVVAGAGTGKTRAITHRIAHAVTIGRYAPSATLAVTFTTRAAGEMKARLARLGAHGVQARTIHSAALRQAQYFWPQAYGAPLPPVSGRTFSLVATAAGRVIGRPETALLRDLIGEISWAKSGNVAPADYPELAQSAGRQVVGVTPEQVATIMTGYERVKLAEGVIDFDDILLCTAALLAEHPDIAAQIQQAYRHFVVDEYQDVSAIQHRLVQLWVGDRRDLCVVGDPFQAIHSFAGARADYLLGFQRDWPDAIRLKLVRNYRSSPEVLAMANRVIGAGGGVRLRATQPSGPTPELVRFPDENEEALGTARWLRGEHDSGVPWSELAVLYRINAQSPAVEAALTELGVPYHVRGSERYYERAEIRQALALVRQAGSSEPDAPAEPALRQVLEQCGWTPDAPASQGVQRERWESLNALGDLVTGLLADNPSLTVGEVADELAQRAAWQQAPVGHAVTLTTMHAAKGLEWHSVALVGIREGLVPFALADTSEALAEERRLLYVAMTRAARRLRITWAAQGGRGRSRFLKPFADQVADQRSEMPRRTSLQAKKCRVCDTSLPTPAERKLGRHLDCPSNYDDELFERLRAWRKQLADEQSLPAFVVFTDATLIALAEAAPTDRAALLGVPGIGTVKADRYGADVLAIVKAVGAETSK